MRVETTIRPNGSRRVQMFCDDPSLTRQEFAEECDLGAIVRRFSGTHEGREAIKNAQGYVEGARFEDVSEAPDFQTVQNIINRGTEAFMGLPASLRTRFDNDPVQFLDFVHDPSNLDELRKLGIAKPLEVTEPVSSVG